MRNGHWPLPVVVVGTLVCFARGPTPSVTATADLTSVVAGQAVTFGASASDATSGVSGAYDWDFGDGTAHGTGAAPVHVYAQPGTYVARAATTDGAGNSGNGTVTIAVAPAPGGGTPGGGSTGGGSTGGGSTGGGSTGGGSTGGGSTGGGSTGGGSTGGGTTGGGSTGSALSRW